MFVYTYIRMFLLTLGFQTQQSWCIDIMQASACTICFRKSNWSWGDSSMGKTFGSQHLHKCESCIQGAETGDPWRKLTGWICELWVQVRDCLYIKNKVESSFGNHPRSALTLHMNSPSYLGYTQTHDPSLMLGLPVLASVPSFTNSGYLI